MHRGKSDVAADFILSSPSPRADGRIISQVALNIRGDDVPVDTVSDNEPLAQDRGTRCHPPGDTRDRFKARSQDWKKQKWHEAVLACRVLSISSAPTRGRGTATVCLWQYPHQLLQACSQQSVDLGVE